MELFRVNVIRKQYHDKLFSNKWLIIAILSSFILQLAVIYTPLNKIFETAALNIYDWGLIFGTSLIAAILCRLFYLASVRFSKEID